MAAPTLEEYRKATSIWINCHRGIAFHIEHFNYSSEEHQGLWRFFLWISEKNFPKRWDDFKCVPGEWPGNGIAFDDEYFPWPIDFAKPAPFYCTETNKIIDAVKVGVDYNHLWNEDERTGYNGNLEKLECGARRTIDNFLSSDNMDCLLFCPRKRDYFPIKKMYISEDGRRCFHKEYMKEYLARQRENKDSVEGENSSE